MEASVAAKALFLLVVVGGILVPLIASVERKQSALMRAHGGGISRAEILGLRPDGLLRSLADMIRIPADPGAIRPFAAAIPALIGFAIIPFGGTYTAWGHEWSLVVADLDYGLLYVFALGSITTCGSLLAGWLRDGDMDSDALRESARSLSYQVALGISALGVFIVFGTLRLTEMGIAQQETFRLLGFLDHLGWVAPGTAWVDWITVPAWGAVVQPLGFCFFLTALMTGGRRTALNAPGSDSYGLTGWVQSALIAGLMTAMFLGGWSVPWLSDVELVAVIATVTGPDWASLIAMLLHVVVFLAKVAALVLCQLLVRWRLERLRHEQVMSLAWKILLPLSLLNVLLTGIGVLVVQELG